LIYYQAIESEELIENDYRLVKLQTSHQEKIDCRYYACKDANKAVIYVGGVGGGWDSPARELYSNLSRKLVSNGISSLRVRYRHPADLNECVIDVITGVKFLEYNNRIQSIGLVGHSLGGAVVIKAAAALPNIIRTVVTLSTQSYGAVESVSELGQEGCSILLIHGTDDDVLSPICSSYVYNKASDPKHIILFKGAGHGLEEAAEEIYQTIYHWLLEHL
jgi:pimeloyl-ACP methyl ester carboxylesterase